MNEGKSTTPTQSIGVVVLIRWLQSGLIPFITAQRAGVLNPPHESTAVKKRGRSGSSLCSQAVHVLFFHAFIISGFIFPAYAVVPAPTFFRGGGGGVTGST